MTETITLPPASLEAIAHNVCSLHGFDPGFVRGQERFAMAVITEYERTRRGAAAGHVHTTLMDAIHGDLMRQHPGAFTEEDGNSSIAIPARGGFVTLDVSALAEAATPKDQTSVERLRERSHHVVELLNGQEFSDDLTGADVLTLALWAWSPTMIDTAQRERVIIFFAGREQAAIDEGDTEGGTDARARAMALIETLEG